MLSGGLGLDPLSVGPNPACGWKSVYVCAPFYDFFLSFLLRGHRNVVNT